MLLVKRCANVIWNLISQKCLQYNTEQNGCLIIVRFPNNTFTNRVFLFVHRQYQDNGGFGRGDKIVVLAYCDGLWPCYRTPAFSSRGTYNHLRYLVNHTTLYTPSKTHLGFMLPTLHVQSVDNVVKLTGGWYGIYFPGIGFYTVRT